MISSVAMLDTTTSIWTFTTPRDCTRVTAAAAQPTSKVKCTALKTEETQVRCGYSYGYRGVCVYNEAAPERASPVVANLGLLNSGGVPNIVAEMLWNTEDDLGANIFTYMTWLHSNQRNHPTTVSRSPKPRATAAAAAQAPHLLPRPRGHVHRPVAADDVAPTEVRPIDLQAQLWPAERLRCLQPHARTRRRRRRRRQQQQPLSGQYRDCGRDCITSSRVAWVSGSPGRSRQWESSRR
jgi:hypothetical protein